MNKFGIHPVSNGSSTNLLSTNTNTNAYFTTLIFCLSIIWMFINYSTDNGGDSYDGTGIRWVLTVIPSLIFWFFYALKVPVIFYINSCMSLFVFMFGAVVFSILNSLKLESAFHAITLGLPFVVLAKFRFYINWKVINIIFVVACISVIYIYEPGVSLYGYLPGQTITNLHEGLWWRISIWNFLTPPYSAAFGLVVFVVNIFFNKGIPKLIFLTFSIYFIFLSASKASVVILFLICLVLISTSRIQFRFGRFFTLFPIISVLLSLLIQFFGDFSSFSVQNDFISGYISRPDEFGDSLDIRSRSIIMLDHANLIFSNPEALFFGIDESVFRKSIFYISKSDSFVSFMFVEYGIISILFFLFFANLYIQAMKTNNLFMYIMLLMLTHFALSYGAFFNFFNPVFLMITALIYHPPEALNKVIFPSRSH